MSTHTLSFSGHESFVCKQFWLKKGFDFVQQQRKFSDERAVVALGVGKNMVNAIAFWLKAFGIVADEGVTDIGEKIFGEQGFDPYTEDIGTLWLLHYQLVTTQKASI